MLPKDPTGVSPVLRSWMCSDRIIGTNLASGVNDDKIGIFPQLIKTCSSLNPAQTSDNVCLTSASIEELTLRDSCWYDLTGGGQSW